MFKLDRMQSVFDCHICGQILENPIILPCGETICKRDLELLTSPQSLSLPSSPSTNFSSTSSSASSSSSFSFSSSHYNESHDTIFCKFCSSEHDVPEGGFPQDKRLQKMLKMHLDNLVHESMFENCRTVLNELNVKAQEMSTMEQDPEFIVFEYFSQIISQVDAHRENLKLKVDLYYFDVIAEIKKVEGQCKENCKNLEEFTANFKKSKNLLHELNRKFDLLELNDRKLNQIARQAHQLKKNITEEVKRCETFLLDNKTYKFEAPDSTSIEDIFGVFKTEEPKGDVYTNYIDSGNNLYKQGRYEEAISFHDQAIGLEPAFSDAYFYKGNALNSLERHAEAIECYDKAIELDSADYEAYTNKGSSLGKMGDCAKALLCYNKALNLNPTYSLAILGKANTLNTMGNFTEALVFYDKLIEIEPDNSLAYFNKGVTLHKLERLEDELACYDVTINLDPTYTDAYYYKAGVLCVLKRFDEALVCLDKNLELDPYSSEAFNCKGEVLNCTKEFDRALSCFNQAIQLNPGRNEYYKNKRYALINLGRSNEAMSCYNLCAS